MKINTRAPQYCSLSSSKYNRKPSDTSGCLLSYLALFIVLLFKRRRYIQRFKGLQLKRAKGRARFVSSQLTASESAASKQQNNMVDDEEAAAAAKLPFEIDSSVKTEREQASTVDSWSSFILDWICTNIIGFLTVSYWRVRLLYSLISRG